MTDKGTPAAVRGTIVHLEDEPAWGLALRPYFANVNIRYVQVGLITDALPLVEQPDVTAVVVDWRLPKMREPDVPQDAQAFIVHIRKRRPTLPVLLLTSYTQDASIRELIEQGFLESNDVYSKGDLDPVQFVRQVVARMTLVGPARSEA